MPDPQFDWSEYLKIADELSKRPEEACHRTAISRAYYAIFHLARMRIIENRFYISQGQDSHKQIWEKFDNPDKSCRKLYDMALRLKGKRQMADYDDVYPRISEDAPAVISQAKTFAEGLSQLDKRLPANHGIKA